jgi:hypothetical protein
MMQIFEPIDLWCKYLLPALLGLNFLPWIKKASSFKCIIDEKLYPYMIFETKDVCAVSESA